MGSGICEFRTSIADISAELQIRASPAFLRTILRTASAALVVVAFRKGRAGSLSRHVDEEPRAAHMSPSASAYTATGQHIAI